MSPTQISNGRKTIRPITGLRGVTVMSVVFLHFSSSFSGLLPEFKYLFSIFAKVGFRMDLFFLLSGFITAYVYINPDEKLTTQTYLMFLKTRLRRLYPSYLAAFVLLALAVFASNQLGIAKGGSYPLSAVPIRLALLHGWPYLSWGLWTWNYPTWFLSALWFAYLFVFPLGWHLTRRVHSRAVALLWVFSTSLLGLALTSITFVREFHIVLHVTCQFISGIGLCWLFLNGGKLVGVAAKYADIAALIFVVGALILPSIGDACWTMNRILITLLPILLIGVTNETSFVGRFLAAEPSLWLGKVSYGVFLTHGIVQKILQVLLPADHYSGSACSLRLTVFLAHLAAVLAGGAAMHYAVEMPVRRLTKAKVRNSRSNEAVVVARGI